MHDSGSSQAPAPGAPAADAAPFSSRELEDFFQRSAEALARAAESARTTSRAEVAEDLERAVVALRSLAPLPGANTAVEFEDLERKLSSLEDVLHSALLRATSIDMLADFKADVARGLGSARRNMTAIQIESLERQFLKKRLFEHYRVPRLSLFYL
jgi:hypothetical protein